MKKLPRIPCRVYITSYQKYVASDLQTFMFSGGMSSLGLLKMEPRDEDNNTYWQRYVLTQIAACHSILVLNFMLQIVKICKDLTQHKIS